MRFEDLASDAGRGAADLGSRSPRPSLESVLELRRRARIAGWVTAVAAVLAVFGAGFLLSARGGTEGPVAAPITTSTTTTTLNAAVGASRDTCPVTLPGDEPFTPADALPDGPPDLYDSVWYGTPELWTMLNHEGESWDALPVAADGTLTQKTFWWREGFNQIDSPQQDITVTLDDLGGLAPGVEFGNQGTGGFRPDIGHFMLVGIDIPGPGCWRITAEHRGVSLSYVAWVSTE